MDARPRLLFRARSRHRRLRWTRTQVSPSAAGTLRVEEQRRSDGRRTDLLPVGLSSGTAISARGPAPWRAVGRRSVRVLGVERLRPDPDGARLRRAAAELSG